MSPSDIPWDPLNVIVTDVDPLVVVNAFVSVVVDLIGSETSELAKVQVKEGDELFIPEKSNNVYVFGEISSEGSVMFSPNKTVEYYVGKSGGFKRFADVNLIYLLYPNGESVRYQVKRNIFESEPEVTLKYIQVLLFLYLENLIGFF